MNCYQKVINQLNLNGDMQDNGSDAVFLLLSALAAEEVALTAAHANVADTYGDPMLEILHRLSAFNGSFAYQSLALFFGKQL